MDLEQEFRNTEFPLFCQFDTNAITIQKGIIESSNNITKQKCIVCIVINAHVNLQQIITDYFCICGQIFYKSIFFWQHIINLLRIIHIKIKYEEVCIVHRLISNLTTLVTRKLLSNKFLLFSS